MPRFLVPLTLLIALLVAPCLPPAAAQDGDYRALRLIEVRRISDELETRIADVVSAGTSEARFRMHGLWLAPTGERIVALADYRYSDNNPSRAYAVCALVLADDDLTCNNITEAAFDAFLMPNYAAWSPDGRYLVSNEDYRMQMRESDLWRLDTTTLTIEALTPDGADDPVMQARDEAMLDYAPMWHPGGDLYFMRTTHDPALDAFTTALYRLPGGEGEPQHVLDLPGAWLEFEVMQLTAAMSPDGTRIALLPYSMQSPQSLGVWLIDLDAGTVEPFVSAEALEAFLPAWSAAHEDPDRPGLWPRQIAWAAGGAHLLVFADNPVYGGQMPETFNYFSIDAASGELTARIDFDRFADRREALIEIDTLPGIGMIAPEGDALITVPRRPDGDTVALTVAPIPFGGEPVTIGEMLSENYGAMLHQYGSTGYGFLGQTAVNGWVLYGNLLLRFE